MLQICTILHLIRRSTLNNCNVQLPLKNKYKKIFFPSLEEKFFISFSVTGFKEDHKQLSEDGGEKTLNPTK